MSPAEEVQPLTALFPAEQARELRELAVRHDRSLGAELRRAVRVYLDLVRRQAENASR